MNLDSPVSGTVVTDGFEGMAIERGEIYRVNQEPTIGGEQQGDARPCLILSIIAFNKA